MSGPIDHLRDAMQLAGYWSSLRERLEAERERVRGVLVCSAETADWWRSLPVQQQDAAKAQLVAEGKATWAVDLVPTVPDDLPTDLR